MSHKFLLFARSSGLAHACRASSTAVWRLSYNKQFDIHTPTQCANKQKHIPLCSSAEKYDLAFAP
jgi:hypothetical protein